MRKNLPVLSSILVACNLAYADPPANPPALKGATRAESRNDKAPNWGLLEYDPADKVTKVTLIMYKRTDVTEWQLRLKRSDRVEIETSDKLVQDHLLYYLAMSYRPVGLDPPSPDDSPPSECIGELHVTTTKRQFMIGINDGPFALEAKSATNKNCFVSWGLAKIIDKVLKDHGKEGLNEGLFATLMPFGATESDRHTWKTVEEKYRGGEPTRDGR